MSWSINLSGSRTMVILELRRAAIELQNALDAAQNLDNEKITVSASGHAFEGVDGSAGLGNSFSVSGDATPAPAVGVEEVKKTQDDIPY